MKKEFLPYYISRTALSIVFGVLVFGFSWRALLFAAVAFLLFLLYLHSGWFQIDSQSPWFPIRRDERAQQVQRKALIAAIIIGVTSYALLSLATKWYAFPAISGSLAIFLAVVTYFSTQFFLLARD